MENLLWAYIQVSPYVFQLHIEQLIGMSPNMLERNPYNPQYKIFNYPPKDCHHGNLGAALSHLTNLRSLTIQFGMKNMKYNYELRMFEMSYTDIENLARFGIAYIITILVIFILNNICLIFL